MADDRLLVGEGDRLAVYDAARSGTEQPPLASVALPNAAQDIAYEAGRAYVVTGLGGLQIVDITGSGVGLVSSLPLVGWARGVAVAEGRAYVAADTGGLRVVDVAEPSRPLELGAVQGEARFTAVAVRPPYAYLADQNATLSVADVTDPHAPRLVYTLNNDATVSDLAVAGDRLYLATTRGLQVFALADPAQPVEIGRYPQAGRYALRSLTVAQGHIFVGHYQSGIEEFRVSAEGQPTPACPGCPSPYADPSRANVVALAAGGGRVYAADGDAWRVMEPGRAAGEGLRLLAVHQGFTLPTAAALADGYAYLAAASQGLAVVNLRHPVGLTSHTPLGDENDPPDARAVAVTARDLFLASGAAVYRFDRADPAAPRLVSRWPLGRAAGLAADDTRLLAAVDDALYSVRLATGETVSTTVGLAEARRLALAGDRVYVAGRGGLRVVRWPLGGGPEVVGAYDGPDATALAVRDGRVALGSNQGVDLLTGDGQRLGGLATAAPVVDLAWLDDTLLVLDAAGRLDWLNVADPAQPARLASAQALDAPSALAVGDGYAAVTDLTAGLLLYRPLRGLLWLPFLSR